MHEAVQRPSSDGASDHHSQASIGILVPSAAASVFTVHGATARLLLGRSAGAPAGVRGAAADATQAVLCAPSWCSTTRWERRRRHPDLEQTGCSTSRCSSLAARVACRRLRWSSSTTAPRTARPSTSAGAGRPSIRWSRCQSTRLRRRRVNRGIEAGDERRTSRSSTTTWSSYPDLLGALVARAGAEPGAARRQRRCCGCGTAARSTGASDALRWSGVARAARHRAGSTRAVRRPGRVFSACAGAARTAARRSPRSGCRRGILRLPRGRRLGLPGALPGRGLPATCPRGHLSRRLGVDAARGPA